MYLSNVKKPSGKELTEATIRNRVRRIEADMLYQREEFFSDMLDCYKLFCDHLSDYTDSIQDLAIRYNQCFDDAEKEGVDLGRKLAHYNARMNEAPVLALVDAMYDFATACENAGFKPETDCMNI